MRDHTFASAFGRFHQYILFLALMAIMLPAAPLAAQEQPVRVWIERGTPETIRFVTVQLDTEGEVTELQPLILKCAVSSTENIGDSSLHLTVSGASGITHEGTIPLSFDSLAKTATFEWDCSSLPPGVYDCRISAERLFEGEMAFAPFTLRVLHGGRVYEALMQAAAKVAELQTHTRRLAETGVTIPRDISLQMEICEAFIAKAKKSFAEGGWRRVDAAAAWIINVCDGVRLKLTIGEPQMDPPLPPREGSLSWDGPVIRRQGRPVFLIGAVGVDDPAATASLCHLNAAAFDAPASGSDPAWAAMVQRAKAAGDAILVSLSTDDTGEPLLSDAVRAAAPDAVCLATAPAYAFHGDKVRQQFARHIANLYPDLITLNRTWRSRFVSCDEAKLPSDFTGEEGEFRPLYISTSAYEYDWEDFHLSLGTAWAENLRAGASKKLPGAALFMAPGDTWLNLRDTLSGVDRQALSSVFPVNGLTTSAAPGMGAMAMSHPSPAIHYVFSRSLAPGKPLIASPVSLTVSTDPYDAWRGRLTQAAVWQAVISGVDALMLAPAGTEADLFAFPDSVSALGSACGSLNAWANVVTALQNAPAPVAILWSLPSAIYDGGDPYLASLTSAYEGSSYFGHNVRFITEDQIAKEGFAGVSALVIPRLLAAHAVTSEAIEGFISQNGVVIRGGRPLPYDERGLSRPDILTTSTRTLLLREYDTPSEYLAALDAAAYYGWIPSPPRLTLENDYPADGVISRHATLDGQDYLFTQNLLRDPIMLYPAGWAGTGVDLLTGKSIAFPAEMEPLATLLIKMDAPPEEPELAAMDDAMASSPTGKVEPVPPPAPPRRPPVRESE